MKRQSELPEPDKSERPPTTGREEPEQAGFLKKLGREVGKSLIQEAGTTFKWGIGGAIVGALALGTLGLVKFGLTGGGIGAVAGAVIGGIGAVYVYTTASSFTD